MAVVPTISWLLRHILISFQLELKRMTIANQNITNWNILIIMIYREFNGLKTKTLVKIDLRQFKIMRILYELSERNWSSVLCYYDEYWQTDIKSNILVWIKENWRSHFKRIFQENIRKEGFAEYWQSDLKNVQFKGNWLSNLR